MIDSFSYDANSQDALQIETEKVLRRAQRVINEARAAVARTEEYFRKENVSLDRINDYLAKNCDFKLLLDVQLEMERTISQAKFEAKSEIKKLTENKKNDLRIKRFKNHI